VAVLSVGGTGLAIPVSTPPPAPRREVVTPEPPSATNLATLPFDYSLIVVLDDKISSEYSKTGDLVRAHLHDPIVVDGMTVAPAGSPVVIRVLRAARAQSSDYYGSVDIAFMPLHLSNGQDLPLRAPTPHLAAYDTVGHESTVGVEEDVTDIFLPVGMLYQAIRKGRNITLGAGSMIRARTVATVSVAGGVVTVATPSPIAPVTDVPAVSYHGMPFNDLPSPAPGRSRRRGAASPTPQPSASASIGATSVASTATTASAGPPASPTPPAISPFPQGPEVQFVQVVQGDLQSRFGTVAQAIAAGYFRYTDADDTGAISYANLNWESADLSQPSQLWYDAGGNLLGADFSEAHTAVRPSNWGVNPLRWGSFGAHVHYVYVDTNGVTIYGKATSDKAFTAAGGDLDDPQAATLVKMGLVPSAAAVTHVFAFPHIWDLEVWVKPNPDGAFAQYNPTVTPATRSTSSP
jgi:hypothetical protein